MREIPIIFSTPMVQAILDGRKTMTRRIVKPQPAWIGEPNIPFKTQDADPKGIIKCPYGQPGDRLWVRETWMDIPGFSNAVHPYLYKADYPDSGVGRASGFGKWRSSRFMPKAAARIWLEVTNIRVERLQEITEKDAKTEGFTDSWDITNNQLFCTARENFEGLWNTLNAKRGYGWETNPWVWVVSFRRLDF